MVDEISDMLNSEHLVELYREIKHHFPDTPSIFCFRSVVESERSQLIHSFTSNISFQKWRSQQQRKTSYGEMLKAFFGEELNNLSTTEWCNRIQEKEANATLLRHIEWIFF